LKLAHSQPPLKPARRRPATRYGQARIRRREIRAMVLDHEYDWSLIDAKNARAIASTPAAFSSGNVGLNVASNP